MREIDELAAALAGDVDMEYTVRPERLEPQEQVIAEQRERIAQLEAQLDFLRRWCNRWKQVARRLQEATGAN